MFQPLLDFAPTGPLRLYALLYPSGTWSEPCVIICNTCDYREIAPTCDLARTLAAQHDRDHNHAVVR
jgi:hypothetical protein